MNHAAHISSNLLAYGLAIKSDQVIEHGHQIRLVCGAVINVYDKGTVLIQGKLHPFLKTENLTLLKQALPPDTKWSASMATPTVTKALVLDPNGFYVERQFITMK